MTDDTNRYETAAVDGSRDGEQPGGSADAVRSIMGLSGLQRDVLFVVAALSGTDPSGSDVQSRFRGRYGREVSHGCLYRNLRELQDEGYVAKAPLDGRTYAFRLTETTRVHLRAYLSWAGDCLDEGVPDGSWTDEADGTDQGTEAGGTAEVDEDDGADVAEGNDGADAAPELVVPAKGGIDG